MEDEDEDPMDALAERLKSGPIKATQTTYHKRNEDISKHF
jgi:hypothetical protein